VEPLHCQKTVGVSCRVVMAVSTVYRSLMDGPADGCRLCCCFLIVMANCELLLFLLLPISNTSSNRPIVQSSNRLEDGPVDGPMNGLMEDLMGGWIVWWMVQWIDG
jgi:hypothetical protein